MTDNTVSQNSKKTGYAPDISTVFVRGSSDEIQVPFDCLNLSNGEKILSYTVKGVKREVPLRKKWIEARASYGKGRTQLELAKAGVITPEMEFVAIRESGCYGDDMAFTPEDVRKAVACGHAVIPANICHPESEPMIIGKQFSVKVNANIGASSLSSGYAEELKKLHLALKHGADTVMDLSTGIKDLMGLRNAILRGSPAPIGTVPVYEALDRAEGKASDLTWDLFKQTVLDQARQGVDYFTIHAGLTADLLPHAAARTLGIVSRGGSIMASVMMRNNAENMAYEHFDELIEICREYDVALSLGDGLRPGCIDDACDDAQYGELRNIGKLAARCFDAGVQCFIEGPGHVPMDKIEENQRLQEQYCNKAPFYTLGPLVTDIAPGYDHITSAIGGAQIANFGTAMLCYVTPSEHLALPDEDDVKVGLVTYKLAAHAADIAKGLPNARIRDSAMARARADFRWFDQFTLSFDPMHAYEVWSRKMPENCGHEPAFCSMCGPRFCPIRLNRALQKKYLKQE
ncbi:MAG: phosphomethylpyrimidine synthase ThiC [Succinatimonas sp.]|nr:phosphomethylpyrimidine synthase ThiC [Succinatimonas sp.]